MLLPGRPRHLRRTRRTITTSCPSPERTSTSWPRGRTCPGTRRSCCRWAPGCGAVAQAGLRARPLLCRVRGRPAGAGAHGGLGPPHRGASPGLGPWEPGGQAVPSRSPAAPTQAHLCPQPGQVVGLDLEWKPCFGAGGRPRASLMQVAVEGHVFLLDLPALSQPPEGRESQAFSRLVSQLLSDPSITKLGERSPRPTGPACPQGGRGEARAPPLGCHPVAPAHRLWDGGGHEEPGGVLPHAGPRTEAPAGRRGPAAGAQAGEQGRAGAHEAGGCVLSLSLGLAPPPDHR